MTIPCTTSNAGTENPVIAIAHATPASAIVLPTDRSIPAVTMTKVIPIETTMYW